MGPVKFVLIACLYIYIESVSSFGIPPISGGGETRNVFITLKDGPNPIIDQINSQTFPNRESKIQALRGALMSHAATSQAPILNFLSGQILSSPIKYESFWISNQVYVQGINSQVVNLLQSTFLSQIASIEDEQFAEISPIEEVFEERNASFRQSQPPWGIRKVDAPSVWNTGNRGSGITVGIIDTGCRGSHEALRSNYVGTNNYGWYDPSSKSRSPNDRNGHGTHCAGTILGTTRNIGVAPEAKWMACKGCASNSCATSHLVACGQFMLCPHDTNGRNPDCSKAPHVVSNSWGGGGSTFYNSIIRSWQSAGIIPIFAAGNSGSRCKTVGYPGSHQDVIAVASTTSSDTLSSFSSRGPVSGREFKPDISAPGQSIYSSWASYDSSYRTISGTSMACPHVAGVVALMLSANENLSYADVKRKLFSGATTSNLVRPSRLCPDGENSYKFPNNYYGIGLVNAPRSV